MAPALSQPGSQKLISILILAFILRFLFFIGSKNYTYTHHYKERIPEEDQYFKEMIPPFDSQEFLALAQNLSREHRFSWATQPNTFRTPLYPIFMALFGVNIPLFLFSQILFGVATVLLLFLTGKQLFGEESGLIAALFFALDIPNILFNSLIMSETLLVFFLTLGTFLLFRNRYLFSGLAFSLAALTKPIALYIFLPILLFLLFSKRLKAGIIFILSFSILILLWMARNYRNYKIFAFTSIDGYNLLYHNLSALEANLDRTTFYEAKEKVWRAVKDRFNSNNPFYLSQISKEYATKRILKHFWRYALIHIKGMFLPLFGIKSDDLVLRFVRYKDKDGRIRNSITDTTLSPLVKGAIFLLGGWEIIIIGIALILFILSLRYSLGRSFRIILFLIMLYFLFISAPLPDGRFRIPSLAFLYLGAASIFQSKKVKEKPEPPL